MKEKINFTSEDVKQMTDEDKRHFTVKQLMNSV